MTSILSQHAGVSADITFNASEISNNVQCYQINRSTTTPDWVSAYTSDPSTCAIYEAMLHPKEYTWSTSVLAVIDSEYYLHLISLRIQLLHGKLVCYKPILKDVKYVGLILVPSSLRCAIFSHFHAGPTGGHMGKYNTSFHICMRFFWLGIRLDIKTWVKGYVHCYACNIWRSRKSKIYLS